MNKKFGLRGFVGLTTGGRRRCAGLTGLTALMALTCLVIGVGVAFAVSGAANDR